AATAGRVNKLVFTDIDAGMTDPAATAIVEEHHITRYQFVALDHRHIEIDELSRGARQLEPGFLAEQETDEAAAVEPALYRAAAVTVWRPDQGEATLQHAPGQSRRLRFGFR